MATIKKYLDYAGLSDYNDKIQAWANGANQIGYKTVLTSADGNNILFYKKPNATLSDVADATIPMGSSSMSDKIDALASILGATWDSVNEEYTITLDSGFGPEVETALDAINDLKQSVDLLNDDAATAGSVANSIATAIAGLDVVEFELASVTNNVVTIKGIKQVDGEIAIGDGAGISLEEVAYTGAAADVSVADTDGHFTATNVEDVLAELAETSDEGIASKTVYITETAGSTSDAFSKRYGIYQGSEGDASDPVIGEKICDIDIPKDMVVEDGKVVDVTFVEGTGGAADKLTAPIGEAGAEVDVTEEIKGVGGTALATDAGKYILLIIANTSSTRLWIKASDLVDVYTGGTTAEVTIAVDNNNVITATINKIMGTKVVYKNAYIDNTDPENPVNVPEESVTDALNNISSIALDGTGGDPENIAALFS